MNTLYKTTSLRNTFAKLDQAIHNLESICTDAGQKIIDCLHDYEDLPFIDLLIKTSLDVDELERQLTQLTEAGMITAKESYYSMEYSLNENRLLLVSMMASRIVQQ